MKQFARIFALSLTLILSAMITGCSDEDSPTTPAASTKPAAPVVSFNGPNTSSTNQYATQAKSASSLFNSQGEMFNAFAQLPGTMNGNVWTYSQTVNGLTTTITSENLSNGSYRWKIIYNGAYSDGGNAGTVSNWTAFEGTTTADGKTGSWKIYAFNSTNVELEMSWATDASGNETGSIKMYDMNVLDEQLDLVNNMNGTGSMTFFTRGVSSFYKNFEVSWIADGTGTYTVYNEAGTITGTGTF